MNWASGGLVLIAAAVAACQVEQLPQDSSSIGGGGGSGATAGAAGQGGGVSCTELHVSPAGSDASTGCDPKQPKQTIGSALDFAHANESVGSILICAGTYDEAIVLDVPIDLLGGYDCTTWTRTNGYGFPEFDAANETTVGGSKLPEALRITGSAADASTLVDGLSLLGSSDASQQDGRALRIDSGAAPVVANCKIVGGATTSINGQGSVGLRIDTGARPEIRSNLIDGGSGVTYGGDVGRVGVYVQGAAASLHDNSITGGSAAPAPSYGLASVGLVLRDASPLTEAAGNPVLGNTILGGDGNGQQDGIASAGIVLFGATDVDIVSSVIRPGASPGKAVSLRGVQSVSTGAIRISKSRIYGGDLSNPSNASLGWRVGVLVDGATSFVAENNMIYGGVDIDGFAGGSPSFALAIGSVNGAIVRHNTLYSGPSGFPTVGTAIKLDAGARAAIIQNNILAASVGWNEPIYADACASEGIIRRLENNLLFNNGTAGEGVVGQLYGYSEVDAAPCWQWEGIAAIGELESHIVGACTPATPGACVSFGGAKASGNLTLQASCGTDPGCVAWPACDGSSMTCLQSVFESWSQDDNGLGTLLSTGWRLEPGVPCKIAKSSLDLGLVDDLFGNPRTAPASMGAHELDGSCTP